VYHQNPWGSKHYFKTLSASDNFTDISKACWIGDLAGTHLKNKQTKKNLYSLASNGIRTAKLIEKGLNPQVSCQRLPSEDVDYRLLCQRRLT
jgi:hypothetical protein